MTRRLKALGLALMATLALGAVVASSAAAAEFHSEREPTVLTGTDSFHEDSKFSISGLVRTCTESNFEGTSTIKTATTLTLFPVYTGCGGTGESAGCWYEIHSHTNATGHLPLTVKCTTGAAGVVIPLEICTLTIPPQTAVEGIQVTNIGSGSQRDITFHVTAKVTVTKSGGGGCAFLGSTLTYTGTGTLRGFEDNDATNHNTNFDEHHEYKEGAQVGIWWE